MHINGKYLLYAGWIYIALFFIGIVAGLVLPDYIHQGNSWTFFGTPLFGFLYINLSLLFSAIDLLVIMATISRLRTHAPAQLILRGIVVMIPTTILVCGLAFAALQVFSLQVSITNETFRFDSHDKHIQFSWSQIKDMQGSFSSVTPSHTPDIFTELLGSCPNVRFVTVTGGSIPLQTCFIAQGSRLDEVIKTHLQSGSATY